MKTENISQKNSIVHVSGELMAEILFGNKEKYDAKKAEKEARKKLRKQGLRV